jgi:hypothetical protein
MTRDTMIADTRGNEPRPIGRRRCNRPKTGP